MIAEIIGQLFKEKGFRYPVFMSTVAANGSCLTGVYSEGEFEMLTEHINGQGYAFPLSLMFVDGTTGQAVRVVITQPDQREFSIN